MAAAAELARALAGWRLRDVGAVWVNAVWELDFTEAEPLDSRLAEEITGDGLDAFTGLYRSLLPFAAEHRENGENIWTFFAENNFSPNALVAVLHHFVQAGQHKRANAQQRVYALHAAGLYFLLLEIPGSIANQLFHQVMFDKCLHTLTKSWPPEPDLMRKRKKVHAQSSQTDARRNRKKGKPCRNGNMDEMLEEEEEEEDCENVYFTTDDLLKVRNSIFLLLKNFLRLLPKFSLKEKPQCVQNCLQIFVEMTNFEAAVHEFEFSPAMNVNEAKYIPELAYHGLRLLCSPLHGPEDKILRCVFQRILNVILMLESGAGSRRAVLAITSAVISARNQAIKFISSVADELKEVIFPVLRILLQHICTKVPDKADYRTHAAQALVNLLNKLPCIEFADFMAWLYKYSRNTKVVYRMFALDVALALLDVPERNLDSSLSLDHQKFLKHKFLVQVMVFGRCSDKAPVVRSKALSSFAHCLEMKAAATLESIQDLLQSSSVHTVLEANTNTASSIVSAEGIESFSYTTPHHPLKTLPTFKTIELTDSSDTAVLDGKEVMAMLRLRAKDEKTNVRKSALQVFMNILKHKVIPCTAEDLSTLQDRCRDPAVSVRKQALQSITELLVSQHNNVLVQKAWLNGVVPVVMDAESSVQEKALDCLDQLLLQHIKNYNKFRSEDGKQALAWDLLTLLTSESQELNHYLNKAFQMWSRQNKFTSTFINNVMSHVETEHAVPAWMLLAKVVGSSPKLDYSKIIESWDNVSRQRNMSTDTTGHILCVMGHVAKHLPKSTCERLIDNIKCWLRESHCPLEVISPAVETLQKLCHASAHVPEEAQELLNQVYGDLVSTCESCISNIVLKEDGAEQLQEDLLVRHLFILGEAAQLCPAKVEKRIFLLIQSILAASVNEDQLSSSPDGEAIPASQPLSQFRGSAMPPVVRAHAFITLGKLCLQHEDLAKKCVAALARELEVSHDVAVRNNVVIVMCDLCIRYTSMVDRYIPNISLCLKDPNPFIRKQTLILLTNLLQEEFVKWKDCLFFHFVSVLVDPNPDIARFGEFCLVHLLLKRNPIMFSQHFIECIFHFNSYEKHEKYNRFPQSVRAKNRFSLKGKDNKEKRMRIYKFLLDHFTDEQRFSITTKISQSILACFVDNVLPLDLEASELLSDTFAVLSCKEIKLSTMRSKPDEDIQADEDEMAMANAVMEAAQKKLISQVQKKNFVENIIPVITSLKSLMEQKRIPALGDLMNYLREMMQDYRNEIKDFFAVDKQLAAELEYDMKKYEEQLAKEKESDQEQVSAAQAEQPPSLERAVLSGGWSNNAQSPLSRRQSLPPGSSPSSVPSECTTSITDVLKQPLLSHRPASLSTLAILNSARKAVEAKSKQRSKSVGGSLSAVSLPSSTAGSKRVSFQSLNQQSTRENVSVVGRAISTPEQTINNLTFGAEVSYISLTQTPSSAPGKRKTEDKTRDIICLTSPEKLPSLAQEWKVESPARKKSSQRVPLRRSQRRAPLKPDN
ncbi:condensin-2 complex subunit D3 isoform X2 [Aquila chrysaetos chrysaetos]|uniref:condensin-2 complex subunit D3 isoform X2 n=1 Tax=Aquila chrysaetos chrysaetos TaxID=223781 RepID=UPI001B7D368D|nr:condensin-2 complex subunit D3 isoform X2 [Aquila chrysaetos chrysaetos]